MENDQKRPRRSMAEILGEAICSGSLEADSSRAAPDDISINDDDVAEVLKENDQAVASVKKEPVDPLD